MECPAKTEAAPMPNVLMVFPRFNQHSFWNLQAVCDTYGSRAQSPPLGMMTLAAMLPADWSVRLVDRNADTLEAHDLDWADMVMTGGMLPQRVDTLTLIDLAHAHGKPVVVGGPDPMSIPEVYKAADFRVLGEAEGIIGEFIAAWSAGQRSGTFEGEKFKVDVTTTPVPRFDLIEFRRYSYMGVQFSRGCPFNCEFCDIIELYGRVPRSKTDEQMLAELEALYVAGYRGHINFVDDNLIGNKKALKRFLPALQAWQRSHGFPFEFSTEASMNLADDVQLLHMLRDANFFGIFVGIESPDTDTLIAMQKKQNTRRDLVEGIHKLYDAGIVVIAGFIVGFDTEKRSVAQDMIDCIEAMSIPVCMVGLLTALPNTQLTRRLEREQRLLPLVVEQGDHCTEGLNFVTARPRRDILADYRDVLAAVYSPAAFFGRLRTVCRALKPPRHPVKLELRLLAHNLKFFGRVMWRMTFVEREYARHFWHTLVSTAWHNPYTLKYMIFHIAFYLHLGPFAQFVIKRLESEMDELDRQPPAWAAARAGEPQLAAAAS
jgi:radical SAM superfamily enzyme YgiQ (UPF0313 family)